MNITKKRLKQIIKEELQTFLKEEGDIVSASLFTEQGILFAKQADAIVDELLNHGYILVSKILHTPEDDSLQEDYKKIKAAFREVEHGEDFIQQLDTAYEVFSR